jgi:hypothetical protein
MNLAWRIYRRLAQAFPHEFKLAYGAEVMQLGKDVVDDIAKKHGFSGLIWLIADIAIRLPLEYLGEMRGDMRYAWRALIKSPGFALVGILSIGLGIGLTTNVSSSKVALLSRARPAAANAKQLVMPERPVSNGQTATIVGITPKNFNGALSINPAELFVPITAPAALAPELANDVLHQRQTKEFLAMMCLAPGVTLESAEAALDAITRRLDEQDPSIAVRADKGRGVTLLPAGTRVPLPRELKSGLIGFFILMMGLIITIACMNLASMLIARGANRRKELAIRLSFGASRFRLVRQMVIEGLLPSLLGGLAGFALAYWLSVLNSQLTSPTAVPVESDFTPDWSRFRVRAGDRLRSPRLRDR